MIDFVRAKYRDKSTIENFVSDPKNVKTLKSGYDVFNESVEYPLTTPIENMEVRVTETSAVYKNSLHKLNNILNNDLIDEKHHNSNDFCYSELCRTIDFLSNKIGDIDNARLTQLEFGLNVEVPIPAEELIKNNFIFHQQALHSHSMTFDGKGEYKQFDHSNYYIKVYDKAKQYKIDKHILRFEIKYKKNKGFNKFWIHNLLDLKNLECLKMLMDDLLMRFDELTIIDDFDANYPMPKTNLKQLNTYTSYNYWEKSFKRKDRNKKALVLDDFQKLLEKNNLLTTKKLIREKLVDKFNELINS